MLCRIIWKFTDKITVGVSNNNTFLILGVNSTYESFDMIKYFNWVSGLYQVTTDIDLPLEISISTGSASISRTIIFRYL